MSSNPCNSMVYRGGDH